LGDGLDDEYRLLGGITTKKWFVSDLETEKESIAKLRILKWLQYRKYPTSFTLKDNDNKPN
jgi:hypothetical protein